MAYYRQIYDALPTINLQSEPATICALIQLHELRRPNLKNVLWRKRGTYDAYIFSTASFTRSDGTATFGAFLMNHPSALMILKMESPAN